jgi:subtilisin family serine protease
MKRLLATGAILIVVFATMVPAWAATDPYRSRQWGLTKIRADQAWSASKGAGVTIAILDTGIDLTHPDLKNKIVSHYACTDGVCSTGSTKGDDDHGHGSHVGGIAAAATNNGAGIAGVAPSARLMAVKVLGSDGSGYCSDIELGIRWAADHGADVINLSLGPIIVGLGIFCIGGLQDATEYAWGKGIVVVISAGNDGLFNLYSSGSLIVVGATAANDAPAPYSNSGADIYAPGGYRGSGECKPETCVFSAWKDGSYISIQGTSQAAPHVSGIAALLIARGYKNTQILPRLKSTADNVNGVQRVNAARAVGSVAGTNTTKPSSSPSSGGRGGSARTPSQSLSPTSAATRSPSVNSLTPLPLPSSSAVLGLRDGATVPPSRPPSRTVVISVAGGFALLAGAAYAGRLLRAGG